MYGLFWPFLKIIFFHFLAMPRKKKKSEGCIGCFRHCRNVANSEIECRNFLSFQKVRDVLAVLLIFEMGFRMSQLLFANV